MLLMLAALSAASIAAPALFAVVGRKVFYVLAGILGGVFVVALSYGGAVLTPRAPRPTSGFLSWASRSRCA